MNICKGFKTNNCACKNKIKKGDYCCHHKYQRVIEFYPIIDNWPIPNVINKRIHDYFTVDLVLLQLNYFEHELTMNGGFRGPYQEYDIRLCIVSMIELIKCNIDICYGHPQIEYLVEVIIKKFYIWRVFDDYIEDFKKKCLEKYRLYTRKKVLEFYFKNVDGLCFDVVEKIMEYV